MSVKLVCLGDVMLARGVSEVLARSEPSELWGDTLPLIHRADIRLANLECCVSDRGEEFQPPRVFPFRAIPKAIDVLTAARVDVVTLANNHSLDYREEALLDTIDRLDAAGIAHVGAGPNLDEARRPAVLETKGKRLAFIGITDNYPEYEAGKDRAGTFHVDIEPDNVGMVADAVAAARGDGADLVVVTAHWGPNMRRHPPDRFQDFARAVVDAGADLWFGHSAHLFQGVELLDGKPILYDGGDFLDDYAVDPVERNDRSLLWEVTLDDGERGVAVYPVQLSFARTDLARGEAFDWISGRLTDLCEEMGTPVRAEDGRLVLG